MRAVRKDDKRGIDQISRRERVELVLTAILVFAALFLSVTALPQKDYELGTVDPTRIDLGLFSPFADDQADDPPTHRPKH